MSLPRWSLEIARDPLGREVGRTLPGGIHAGWKRDAFGRPERRELRRRVGHTGHGAEPQFISDAGYKWQSPDQISGIMDSQVGPTHYQYDPRGHLVAALFQDGTVQHRASDAVGNLFRTREQNDRRYGRGGRLERANGTVYRYDEHGNLVEKVLADGARWTYNWTPSGRLQAVVRPDGQQVRFQYDALGRRIRKEFGGAVTEYVWDGDELVHERMVRGDDIDPVVTWLFEPGTFAPAAKFEGKKRYSVINDHLGTPSALYAGAGELAWKAQLDIYGVPREDRRGIAEGNATGNPWRYPGQYEDAETGPYYNRFWYYDPETARYISEDPIGLAGGTALYGHVADPLGWVDPWGLARRLWSLTDANTARKMGIGKQSYFQHKTTLLWWSRDTAGHGGAKFKVFNENAAVQWFRDADEFGDFIDPNSKHKGPKGKTVCRG